MYRNLFPIFGNIPDLVYLDSSSTTMKPESVINAISYYYAHIGSNTGRGEYPVASQASEKVSYVRSQVQAFVNAGSKKEIIFTRGSTDGLNLLAHSLVATGFFQPGDEILVSQAEHHSNLLPWQEVCRLTGAMLRYIPIDEQAHIDINGIIFTPKTKLLAITHVSNVTGTIYPIKEIIAKAHNNKVNQFADFPEHTLVAVDCCQAIAHIPLDVQYLDADFYVFSAHKMYGPTGLGIMYGKQELLELLRPGNTGGGMVDQVYSDTYTTASLPNKFEAGTLPLAEIYALEPALEIARNSRNYQSTLNQLHHLFETELLQLNPNIQIIGQNSTRTATSAFVIPGIDPIDVGTYLAGSNICIRTGTHCAQILHQAIGQTQGTNRVSFGIYNTKQDVIDCISALQKLINILHK